MARAALRLARVALHLALGATATMLPIGYISRPGWRRRRSADLLSALGVRLEAPPVRIAPGTLVVANHVSWLDALVLDALCPASFVAKDEIRRWPLLGWLLRREGTIFLRRGFNRGLPQVVRAVQARLARGETIACFPEGTTSDGRRLLPFRAALFESAARGGTPVAVFALRYRDGAGRHSDAAAFIGGQSLVESLVAIASADGLCARAELRAVFPATSRRDACRAAQEAVQEGLRAGRPMATRVPSTFTPAAMSTAEA